MRISHMLKNEINKPENGTYLPNYYRTCVYDDEAGPNISDPMLRAKAIYSLFTLPTPHVYKNDLIAGSLLPLFCDADSDEVDHVKKMMEDHPERGFSTNSDHFSPDYDSALKLGVPGLLRRIAESKEEHADTPERIDFLSAMELTVLGLRRRLEKTAEVCRALIGSGGYRDDRLEFMAANCEALTVRAPQSFAEAHT